MDEATAVVNKEMLTELIKNLQELHEKLKVQRISMKGESIPAMIELKS